MFDDDRDLDDLISRGLKSYAEDAAAGRQSAWPRIRSALHRGQPRRRRGIRRLWIIPAVVLPLAVSAGTATALYSHSAPIVWIFHAPAKPSGSEIGHAYVPPPVAVSLQKGSSLLGVRLLLIHGTLNTQLKSVSFQGATTTSKSKVATSEKGSVTLIYNVQGRTVSLREYKASPGPLVSKLRKPSDSTLPRETLSVMTLDGGTYQMELSADHKVLFVEWKTLRGVQVILNGSVAQSLPLIFVRALLPSIY